MSPSFIVVAVWVAAAFSSCAAPARVEVLEFSEVQWTPLNPARGDSSPLAGTLWGDRAGSAPTGFLFRPADGFSSPPHIHNVSYRGVVIHGRVHNADPRDAELWMPAGSFWTQPKGDVHITAARGHGTLAYIEIDEGPYLVRPVDQAFDSGEPSINTPATDIAWVDAPGFAGDAAVPRVAQLWGASSPGAWGGALVRLPRGSRTTLHAQHGALRAVVIAGHVELREPGAHDARTLAPGSLVTATDAALHVHAPASGDAVVLYVRTRGGFDLRGVAAGDA